MDTLSIPYKYGKIRYRSLNLSLQLCDFFSPRFDLDTLSYKIRLDIIFIGAGSANAATPPDRRKRSQKKSTNPKFAVPFAPQSILAQQPNNNYAHRKKDRSKRL